MAQRILIADDSEEIIEILQILLTGEGYEVVTAGDGEEAVMLADNTIDLIILDVMMPVKSRCKSLLRRYLVYQGKSFAAPDNRLVLGDLSVDQDTRTVTVEGRDVNLTSREYCILVLLLKNRRKIFSSENIYESVWNEPYFYSANNNVMVHIRNLRRKIEKDPQNPEYIKTMWGRGYYIE